VLEEVCEKPILITRIAYPETNPVFEDDPKEERPASDWVGKIFDESSKKLPDREKTLEQHVKEVSEVFGLTKEQTAEPKQETWRDRERLL